MLFIHSLILVSLISGYNDNGAFTEDSSAYAELYAGEPGEAFSGTGEFTHDTQDFMSGGEFQESQSLLVDGGDRFGVSAVTVDRKEELVWMGNSGVSKKNCLFV